MLEYSCSIGNHFSNLFVNPSLSSAASASTGSVSRPTPRNTRDLGMSAPSNSNEIFSDSAPHAPHAPSDVISVSDGDDYAFDDPPVPQHSSLYPPSKKIEASRPQSPRQHSKRNSAQRVTRSHTQADRVALNRCLEVDDQSEAQSDEVPGSTGRKRTTRQVSTLALTARTSATHDLFVDASSPAKSGDLIDYPQCSNTDRHPDSTESLQQNTQRHRGVIPARRPRASGNPSEKPLVRVRCEIEPERKHFENGNSSDRADPKPPPTKRHRGLSNPERFSPRRIPPATPNDSRSQSSDSSLTYNRESLQRDRARREGAIAGTDLNISYPLNDKRAPSAPSSSKRYETRVHPDTNPALAATVDISEHQVAPRRSQRVKNASQASKEQGEAARELVELDAFTVNEPYTGPTHTIFVFPPGKRGSITVTVEERERLKERLYLNDSLIDFYIKYLQTSLQSQARSPEKIPFFYSSFFFKRMIQKRPIDYNGVKSWTKDIDIFKRKYIFVPICDSYHWSLIIIINLHSLEDLIENGSDSMDAGTRPKIIYMDSLDPERGSEFGSKIIHYLSEEYHYRKAKDEDTVSELGPHRYRKVSKIVKILKPRVPVQSNEYDCGLYLLQCLKLFVSDPYFQRRVIDEDNDLEDVFSHTEVELLRKDICDLMDRLEQNWNRRTSDLTGPENRNTETKDSEIQQVARTGNSVENAALDCSKKKYDEPERGGRKRVNNLDIPTGVDHDQFDNTSEPDKAEFSDDGRFNVNRSNFAKSLKVAKRSVRIGNIESVEVEEYDVDSDLAFQSGNKVPHRLSKADVLTEDVHGGLEPGNGESGKNEADANELDAVMELSEESASDKAKDDVLEDYESVEMAEGYGEIKGQGLTQAQSFCEHGTDIEPTDDQVMVIEPDYHSNQQKENPKAMSVGSDSENAPQEIQPQLTRSPSGEMTDLVDKESEPIEVSSVVGDEPASVIGEGQNAHEAHAMENGVASAMQPGIVGVITINQLNCNFTTPDHVSPHRGEPSEERVGTTNALRNSWPSESSFREQSGEDISEPLGVNAPTGSADVEEVKVQARPGRYGGRRIRVSSRRQTNGRDLASVNSKTTPTM